MGTAQHCQWQTFILLQKGLLGTIGQEHTWPQGDAPCDGGWVEGSFSRPELGRIATWEHSTIAKEESHRGGWWGGGAELRHPCDACSRCIPRLHVNFGSFALRSFLLSWCSDDVYIVSGVRAVHALFTRFYSS